MPIPEYKRRGNDAYNAKCDRIAVQPAKAIGNDIRNAASSGQSLQGYILQAVRERMSRDGFTPTTDLWSNYPNREAQQQNNEQ